MAFLVELEHVSSLSEMVGLYYGLCILDESFYGGYDSHQYSMASYLKSLCGNVMGANAILLQIALASEPLFHLV